MTNEYGPGKCGYCGAITWVEARARGTSQCRGCKVVSFFRWMYSFIGYEVLTWQERELRSLYGMVEPDTGLRKYRRGYIEIPKKNGKSWLISALLAYKLNWQSVVFVGYGDDRELSELHEFERASRQFFVKMSYAFQR